MEASNEIRSAAKNIRYYCGKIEELSKAQFNRDFEIGQVTGINTGAGSMRFDCLGAIGVAADWIKAYCDNIEKNLESAEKLDDKLRLPNEEEEEPKYGEEAVTPEEFR